MGLGDAAVAGMAGSGDGDGLVDAAFDAGSARVAGLPAVAGLFGACCGLGLVCLAGQDAELPAVASERGRGRGSSPTSSRIRIASVGRANAALATLAVNGGTPGSRRGLIDIMDSICSPRPGRQLHEAVASLHQRRSTSGVLNPFYVASGGQGVMWPAAVNGPE